MGKYPTMRFITLRDAENLWKFLKNGSVLKVVGFTKKTGYNLE